MRTAYVKQLTNNGGPTVLGALALALAGCGGGGGGGGGGASLSGDYFVCIGTYTKTDAASGMVVVQNEALFRDNFCGQGLPPGAPQAVNSACTCAVDRESAITKCQEELAAQDATNPGGAFVYSYTVSTAEPASGRAGDQCDPDADEIASLRQSLVGGTAESSGPLSGTLSLSVTVEITIGIPPFAVTETRTFSDSSGVSGRADYSVIGELGSCPAGGCGFELSRLVGTAGNLNIEGNTGTNITFLNAGMARGTVQNDGSVNIPAGNAALTVNFDQNGTHNARIWHSDRALTGRLTNGGATLELDTIQIPQGSAVMRLSNLRVQANVLPPTALIAPNGGTFECASPTGTVLSFDGRSSTSSIDQFLWRVNGGAPVLTTGLFQREYALGDHELELTVVNALGGSASTDAAVSIVNTTPPTIVPSTVTTVATCDVVNQGSTLVLPTVTDSCSGVQRLSGRVVATNGVPLGSPIELVNGHGALPVGQHEVIWEALDNEGNIATLPQLVSVVPAFYGTHGVYLPDGAKLRTPFGNRAVLANGSGGRVELGVEANSGEIRTLSPVFLRERAQVFGRVLSAQGITTQNGVLSEGLLQFTNPNLAPPVVRSVATPPGGSNVMLEPGQVQTLAPGSYGQLGVKSRATLRLSSGVYFLLGAMIEPDAIIELNGNVELVIRNDFTFRGILRYVGGSRLIVSYLGTSTAFIEREFPRVSLYAPNAKIVLGAANIQSFVGTITAREIEAAPRATIVCSL